MLIFRPIPLLTDMDMGQINTHYDNLKIARDAPPEIIRAAYKALCHQYHPDLHSGNPDADRIMKTINIAYEVLMDPIKRKEHDKWFEQQERTLAEQVLTQAFQYRYSPTPPDYSYKYASSHASAVQNYSETPKETQPCLFASLFQSRTRSTSSPLLLACCRFV